MDDDELAGLLLAGERAVFRGVPGQGVVPLEHAERLAGDLGDATRRSRAAWLLGMGYSATGHFGRALTVLTSVAEDDSLAPELRSMPASAVASVQRQLGRAADARHWDQTAVDSAGSNEEARCDALLGLAADFVGLGDDQAATGALREVEALVAQRPLWWRQRIRMDWVRSEIALLTDQPGPARTAAERALDLAEEAGAPRHVAKSLLFAGVAATAANQLGEAVDLLSRAAVLAEGLGARPLIWPSRAMLGALQAQSAAEESAHNLEAARVIVRDIAADLPTSLAADWLARRDVASLLG